jgi:hypothetical protein
MQKKSSPKKGEIVAREVELIMDSGAFSAWNIGAEILLDDYIAYCLDRLDVVDYFVNLDVIPSAATNRGSTSQSRGVSPHPYNPDTPQIIEAAAKQGWKNLMRMVDAGIPKNQLIPVFHQGENFKWLEKMLDLFEYVGLSPANDKTTAEKRSWLDNCMSWVTDRNGRPIVKFHGFAVTSFRLMMRYPWYSVDSASWVTVGRHGQIYVPRTKDGSWDYTQEPLKITLSAESFFAPNKKKDPDHYRNLPESTREIVDAYLAEKGKEYQFGKSSFRWESADYKRQTNERLVKIKDPNRPGEKFIETIEEMGAGNNYKRRDELNIWYYIDFEKILPAYKDARFEGATRGLGI